MTTVPIPGGHPSQVCDPSRSAFPSIIKTIKIRLRHAAVGAAPVVGDVCVAGAGREAVVGIAGFLVVDVVADGTGPCAPGGGKFWGEGGGCGHVGILQASSDASNWVKMASRSRAIASSAGLAYGRKTSAAGR